MTEQLAFEPDGEGEFVLARVEKVERNTVDVAHELARTVRLPSRAVTWAGRKDRRAVACQWFCLHLPGRGAPDVASLGGPGWHVVEARRHRRKLRIGALAGNRFSLVLRDVTVAGEALGERLAAIERDGVPNYFGPQRFGSDGRNLLAAAHSDRVQRRNARSMALSAARAAIFNQVLAARVADGSWQQLRPGEVPMLRGSHSIFGPEPITEALAARAARGEVDATGPLWGRGALRTEGALAALEQAAAAELQALAGPLEAAGLRQERRRLRLRPADLALEPVAAGCWRLSFALEAGAFATSIVREVLAVGQDPSP